MPPAVAPPLLLAVPLGVVGVGRTPVTPVVAVAAGPAPLRLRLIGPVVLVALPLALLPAPPALAVYVREGLGGLPMSEADPRQLLLFTAAAG